MAQVAVLRMEQHEHRHAEQHAEHHVEPLAPESLVMQRLVLQLDPCAYIAPISRMPTIFRTTTVDSANSMPCAMSAT